MLSTTDRSYHFLFVHASHTPFVLEFFSMKFIRVLHGLLAFLDISLSTLDLFKIIKQKEGETSDGPQKVG